jgi:hypothetical protein
VTERVIDRAAYDYYWLRYQSAELGQRAHGVFDDYAATSISLEARDKRYVGDCPFCENGIGRFAVNPATRLYYCFGCESGGQLAQLIREGEA